VLGYQGMSKPFPDIIVIGGGVIGLASAWKLAQRGVRVKLLERNFCGCGASNASMGVLAPPTPLSHNPLQLIHRKSLSIFSDFVEDLENCSGIKVNFTRCGSLEIIPSGTQYERARRETLFTKENTTVENLPSVQVLSPKEVLDLEPSVNVLEYGALYTPSAAKVDVEPFIQALKAACLNSGVEIIEGKAVEKIIVANGSVNGVIVSGSTLPCAKILAAAGVWMPDLGSPVNTYTTITPVRGQGILIKFAGLRRIIKWQKGYLVPYPNNTVALGGTTEKKAGFDESCTVDGIASILERAKTVFPAITPATFIKHWAGLRPAPADRRPFMGRIPNINGLSVSGGHYKIGFSLVPYSSEVISRAILAEEDPAELLPFSPREVH
jgi:glycine oxidase